MDNKEKALLRVTNPEKYQEVLAREAILKKMMFPKLFSNKNFEGEYVARLYDAFEKDKLYVVEPDGSHHAGKITKRKVYQKLKNDVGRPNGGIWIHYYELADGRFFNNSGWQCEKPKEDTAPVDENKEE
jgi:hypothetical protein|tara:strand:+ start:436 stop:822 length:387 start_codon:yes stop_codon:yes gene_type:complete